MHGTTAQSTDSITTKERKIAMNVNTKYINDVATHANQF